MSKPDRVGLLPIANASSAAGANIVFVHGLGGASHSTWTYGSPDSPDHFFWPKSLGEDLPQCGVWTVGYPAGISVFGEPGMTIDKSAGNLAQKLANAGLCSAPIVFVTHSMGGLIVKSLVVKSQVWANRDSKSLVRNLRGLVFCGTPHKGSAYANAGAALCKLIGGAQRHVKQMQAAEDELDILHQEFLEWQRRSHVPVLSFVESRGLLKKRWILRPLRIGLVVPRASANPGIAGHEVRDVYDDHLSMVKPPDRSHDVYAGVLRWLREDVLSRVEPEEVPRETPERGEARKFKYDFALSFAGEDRGVVEIIAAELRRRGIYVFYDSFEQAELWGKDLTDHLAEVYSQACQYCVLFLSRDYLEKHWTSWERRAAQSRSLTEESEFLLPIRLDDCPLPPTLQNLASVDLRDTDPLQVVDLLCSKLGQSCEKASAAFAPDLAVIELRGPDDAQLDPWNVSNLRATLGKNVDINALAVVGFESSPPRLHLQGQSDLISDLRHHFLNGTLSSPRDCPWKGISLLEGDFAAPPSQTPVISPSGRSAKRDTPGHRSRGGLVCHLGTIEGREHLAQQALSYIGEDETTDLRSFRAFVTKTGMTNTDLYVHSNFRKSGYPHATKLLTDLPIDLFEAFLNLVCKDKPSDAQLAELRQVHQRSAKYFVDRKKMFGGLKGDELYVGAMNVQFV